MKQGPPQTPPHPEKLEFKILKPGDNFTITDPSGQKIVSAVHLKERAITAGQDTVIILHDYDKYLYVHGIQVHEGLRGQGIGYQLFEEALKLAKKHGKKGLLIYPGYIISPAIVRIFERFKKQGRTKMVNLGSGSRQYQALLN